MHTSLGQQPTANRKSRSMQEWDRRVGEGEGAGEGEGEGEGEGGENKQFKVAG